MVVRMPPGGGYRLHRRPMPGPVLVTVLAFVILALLFALATAHRVLAEDGSLGAAVFFATMTVACGVVAVGLVGCRTWAPYPAYVLAGLLAVASLGLFGAITIVGLALFGWVLFSLTSHSAREWLGGPRRLR